jgi:hypothetical protein
MTNTLSVYEPIFYAQEALGQLEKALGMASRVHRGYDKIPQQKGSIISIRRPGAFTAQDAPSAAQDIEAGEVQVRLSNWKEVKFSMTDRELAGSGEVIVADHIRPAAVALADAIDQSLCALYADVPWHHDVAGTAGVADIISVRRQMFDNKVPLRDPAMLHWMLDGDMEADLLSQSAFTQWQGAGTVGAQSQVSGVLGQRFGFNFFANQNVRSHAAGTLSQATPSLQGGHAKGATSITLAAATLTGSLKKGDTLVIAGNDQRYAVTADATASGNAITVTVTPALVQAYPNAAAVSVSLDDHAASLAFHRNAFALAMAPLSELGNQLGARIATVTDPVTGLTLRSRLFYDGNNSTVFVALDALWGVTTLDPNLAVRARN